MGRLMKPRIYEPKAVGGTAVKPAQRSQKACMGSMHWSELDPPKSQCSISKQDSSSRIGAYIDPPKSVFSTRGVVAKPPGKRATLEQRTSYSKDKVQDWLRAIPGKRQGNAEEQKYSRKPSEQGQNTSRSSIRPRLVKAEQILPGSNPAFSSIGSSKSEASRGVSPRGLEPTESTNSQSTWRNSIFAGQCVPGRHTISAESPHLKCASESKRWGQICLQRKKKPGTNPPSDDKKKTQVTKTVAAPTKVKPFALRSAALHERAVQKQHEQKIAMELADKKTRLFKAKTCNHNPRKEKDAREKNYTVGVAPLLQSKKRAQHWANVIKPQQDEKENVKIKIIMEKKKSEEMFMARILQISRQALVHQARPMPDFSKVFKPDLSLAARPTRPCPPRLTCVLQAA